jgi:hypothetical protein
MDTWTRFLERLCREIEQRIAEDLGARPSPGLGAGERMSVEGLDAALPRTGGSADEPLM